MNAAFTPAPLLVRFNDWHARLSAHVAANLNRRFAYGTHDCAMFAFGGVAAMTGVDLVARWRDRYTTLRGGIRLLRRDGYSDHVDLAARHLPEVAPRLAHAGDLAVVTSPDGPAMGIVQGMYIYALLPGSPAVISLLDATAAFRVG